MDTATPISTTTTDIILKGYPLWLARIIRLLVVSVVLVSLVVCWPNLVRADLNTYTDLRLLLLSRGIPSGWLIYYTLGWRILSGTGFFLAAMLLGWRKPRSWMAIIASITCFAFGIGFSFETFNPRSYADTFLAGEAGWLANLNLALGFIASLLMLYQLPDGRFVFKWMRWPALFWVIFLIGGIFFPILDIHNKAYYPVWAFLLFQVVFYGLGLGAQVYRFKHQSLSQRQQMKWLVIGISLTLFGYLLSRIPELVTWKSRLEYQMALAIIGEPLYYAPRALLALTLIFSILRFRLWDIDFVINRSLVYGSLTLLLTSIFGLTIYLVSLLMRGENAVVTVALAAVVAGASFQPVRVQLKHLVDKKLFKIQIDYQRRATPKIITPATFVQAGLGKYQNMELVGRGGMAEVYRATHPTLNMPVALKILSPQLSSQANFRRRFEREAQIMSGLEHPNIARVFDYGVENGTHYIVMEYVNGQDLGRLLKTQKCFPLQDTLSILEPIASALDYAHQGGLVHRDVKPSNILIEKETKRPVLMDFGIAKLTNQTALTGTGGMVGTLDYIAPEQIQAVENIDGRADIYSLSILAYQLLTGELPFSRQNAGALLMAHLTQPPPDIRIVMPDLSSATAHALMRGMSKRPADRPTSACELVTMLA